MRNRHLLVAVLALAACSSPPCEAFCRMSCEHAITCKDGEHPAGDALDRCVQDCTDFVEAKGATSDAACECSGPSCATTPDALWARQYSC